MGSKGFSTNFNLLYSLYSLPNVILPLFGGNIVDKVGASLGMVSFSVLLLLGQLIFGIGMSVKHWSVMFMGRFVYGLGGESISVASSTLAANWFDEGGELALAFGINLAVSRLGSVLNNCISPSLANNIGPSFAAWFGCILNALSCFSALGIHFLHRRAQNKIDKLNNTNALLTASLLEDDRQKDNFFLRNNKPHYDIDMNNDVQSVSLNSLADKSTTATAAAAADSKNDAAVKLSHITRFGTNFWLLTLSCMVIYGCIRPFNNVASGILLQRNYFVHSSCQLAFPGSCASGTLVHGDNSYINPDDGSICTVHHDQAPPLPTHLNITATSTNDNHLSWKHDSYVFTNLRPSDVNCEDPFWSKGCTSNYCNVQKTATEKSARVMSIPYLLSAILSPFLGFVVDRIGCRAVIALFASVLLIVVHVVLAVTQSSPIIPLIGQGLAYSMYAAVIWPSIPLVVPQKYTGTAFGVITSVQNIGLVTFPLMVAAVYNNSHHQYIPNVEYFFVICASLGVLVGVFLNYIDFHSGHPLNKVHKPVDDEHEDLRGDSSDFVPLSDDASYI